nr:reverse transcriptase domain-containing protein [Tanacetum cinerariifolium]
MDFVVVNFKVDPCVPLILGRSFLRTGRALVDVYGEEITLRVNDEAITFNLNQTTRYSSTYDDFSVNRIDIIDVAREEYAQEMLEGDICLIEKLLNNDLFQLSSMDLKQGEVVKAKSSIEEPPKLELKDLPSHLEYDYLEGIASDVERNVLDSEDEKSEHAMIVMSFKHSSTFVHGTSNPSTLVLQFQDNVKERVRIPFSANYNNGNWLQMGTTRGVISDKWSMRVLWLTAIGSAVGLYMVAVERQTQNREKMLAESLRAAAEADANNA